MFLINYFSSHSTTCKFNYLYWFIQPAFDRLRIKIIMKFSLVNQLMNLCWRSAILTTQFLSGKRHCWQWNIKIIVIVHFNRLCCLIVLDLEYYYATACHQEVLHLLTLEIVAQFSNSVDYEKFISLNLIARDLIPLYEFFNQIPQFFAIFHCKS